MRRELRFLSVSRGLQAEEEAMIRNLIFDMGGVLLACEPEAFVRKYCPDPQDASLVNRQLFGAPGWVGLDRGTVTDEDYLSQVLNCVPTRLRTVASYLFWHWHEMSRPDPEMERLVRALKKSGKKIFLLSNVSARFYRFYRNIPAMRYFDGMLVSADVHFVKPEPEIYGALFDRFGLSPEECFFVGMPGYWYRQDMDGLVAALRAAGIFADQKSGR